MVILQIFRSKYHSIYFFGLSVWGGPESLGSLFQVPRYLLGPCTAAIDVCPFGLFYMSPMIDDDDFLEQLVE
jgi:hypothetical protein